MTSCACFIATHLAWCTIIADGVHVHPALLRLLVQVKPRGKVVLVTDAMPTSGPMPPRLRCSGAQRGHLVTDDGTLAGADIDLAASWVGGDEQWVGEPARHAGARLA